MIRSKAKARLVREPETDAALPARNGSEMKGDLIKAMADDATADRPVRTELVSRVKRQIELGLYDEEAKLDAVLDRLLDELMPPGPAAPVTKRKAG